MEVGKDVADETLQERIDNLAPNKCCTLIYTVSTCILSFCFCLASHGINPCVYMYVTDSAVVTSVDTSIWRSVGQFPLF